MAPFFVHLLFLALFFFVTIFFCFFLVIVVFLLYNAITAMLQWSGVSTMRGMFLSPWGITKCVSCGFVSPVFKE